MRQFTITILALLSVMFVSELDCFAQRGGRGGGQRSGGSRGGMSRGGGSQHSGRSAGRSTRSSQRSSGSTRSTPSRGNSSSRSSSSLRRSSPTRSASPSRSVGSSASRRTRSAMRPGSSTNSSRSSQPRSSRNSISSRQRNSSSNPGLRSGSSNRSRSGFSNSNSSSRSSGRNPGLSPRNSRSRSGNQNAGRSPGLSPRGSRSRSGNQNAGRSSGLSPRGSRNGIGSQRAYRSPGLKSGGSRRGDSHRSGHANNRSYYYRPGYWSGYRSNYGFGLGYGYGRGYRRYGYSPYYHYRRYGYRPWVWTTFGGLSTWIGYNSLTPVVYNYSVSDGYIYNDGAQVAPVTVYESQADQIADSVPPPEDAAEWMSAGVFAIVPQGTKDVNVTVQLAVGKNGAIAGTYFNKDGNISLPIQGAIDEAKQRVAWKIGEEDPITMETGLDSLTRDKSTVIIYFSDGVSEIWDMLRIDQDTARLAQQELTQDELRYELLSAHQELDQIVNDVWKDYLALPESLTSTGSTPSLSELEPVVKNYQQIQLDSKYHMVTDRSEFQNTYQLLQDYLKELKQQSLQQIQKTLPAPPVTSQPELVAPKP